MKPRWGCIGAAAHNDGLMLLDEVNSADPVAFHSLLCVLFNGVGNRKALKMVETGRMLAYKAPVHQKWI